jgi:hypothetical protein
MDGAPSALTPALIDEVDSGLDGGGCSVMGAA